MKNLAFFSVFAVLFFTNAFSQSREGGNIVVIKTNQGDITVQLMPETAPKACENFLLLAKNGYYNNAVFHRVIRGFMIQTGDPTGTGRGGESIWGAPFQDEVNENVAFGRKGLVAMANRGPNTNGSQFFITTAETPWLNMKHTIFGEVIDGYQVVEKIESAATDSTDRPLAEQKILRISILK